MKRTHLILLMVLTLGACRSFQNPDAQVIDQDTKITGAADLTSSLLISDVINADEADAIHAGLKVAKAHVDRMREVLLVAKKENREPTDLELRQARSFRQLSIDALKVATQKLAEYEARKER